MKPFSTLFAGLTLAILTSAPAQASLVDRAQVTLGALAQRDLACVVEVRALKEGVAFTEVQSSLKGAKKHLELRLGAHVSLTLGERALVFVRLDEAGRPLPLLTPWALVRLQDEAQEALVLAALRTRLPSEEGDAQPQIGALFAQLSSPLERLRVDAAYDLLRLPTLEPAASERAALLAAFQAGPPSEALLDLARRLPSPELTGPVLNAIGSGDPYVQQAACQALGVIDVGAALLAFAPGLEAGREEACAAAKILGDVGGAPVARRLAEALADSRPEVRAALMRALSECRGARALKAGQATLSVLAEEAPWEEARLALATLARLSAGQALAELQRNHPDAERRYLAKRLRADPVTLARRILRETP